VLLTTDVTASFTAWPADAILSPTATAASWIDVPMCSPTSRPRASASSLLSKTGIASWPGVATFRSDAMSDAADTSDVLPTSMTTGLSAGMTSGSALAEWIDD
jgi:hypothetical protein